MTRDDEAQVLRRMLPAPDERDFPAGRRNQREDHLMTSIQHLSLRSHRHRHRRLAAGLGLPMAAATVAVAAVVALGPSVNDPARLAPGLSSTAAGASSVAAGAERDTTTARISTVGYVLAVEPDDKVKITVRPAAAGTVDPAQFQKDLAAMGIQATVSRGVSTAHAQTTSLATRDRNGNYEAHVSRRVPTPVRQVILFPLGEPTPQGWQAVDVLTVSITHR